QRQDRIGAAAEARVQLEPVASAQRQRLLDSRARQEAPVERVELGILHGEGLALLEGRGFVVDAEERERAVLRTHLGSDSLRAAAGAGSSGAPLRRWLRLTASRETSAIAKMAMQAQEKRFVLS